MTTEVVFDTWAWWEVFANTPVGRRLRARHLDGPVHTSAWAVAELAAKLHSMGQADRIPQVESTVRSFGAIIDVNPRLALEGARLRAELRKKAPRASLGDGVILATARSLGLKLVSGDAAFGSEPDVVH